MPRCGDSGRALGALAWAMGVRTPAVGGILGRQGDRCTARDGSGRRGRLARSGRPSTRRPRPSPATNTWFIAAPLAMRICLTSSSPDAKAEVGMHFDLTDLGLFRHVVEAGSITKGAERAHLALAAASTRIRNLERSLGAPLLLRGRQGVVPTPAGRTLLQHARVLLAQAERLREDLGTFAGGLAGQIRILSNTNALTE